MQKISLSVFAFIFLFANFGVLPVHAAGSATLSLSPTNTSIQTGKHFSLSVMVHPNGESLDTVRLNLGWDASKLEVLQFDLGSLFPSLSPSNSINNVDGTLSYGAYKFGTPVIAEGTVATVTFRALKSSTATISVKADSKLIHDGTEKLNTAVLGVSTIFITGDSVASETTPTQPVVLENTEVAALKYFGAFAGRLPSSSEDWEAIKCMVDDRCKPAIQDINKEQLALELYTKKYGSLPKTSMEWNALHAIAYTNVFIQWDTTVVPVAPIISPVKTSLNIVEGVSITQQAIGWFEKLTGNIPTTDAELKAIDYMVYGFKPATQNLVAESAAISRFVKTFGFLPSSYYDWNVIAAMTYSGAF